MPTKYNPVRSADGYREPRSPLIQSLLQNISHVQEELLQSPIWSSLNILNYHSFSVSSLRSSSVREQLAAASAAVSATNPAVPAPSPGPCSNPPRTLFGRLGIRKPSILSLTSPHASSGGYQPATARTFSLDDLLKPPPRRKAMATSVYKIFLLQHTPLVCCCD